MRPALYARRPAWTAYFIASAIAIGSCAPAMAVFMRTASAPYSMAKAASDAVPTPASTMIGTFTVSMMIFKLYGFRIPRPDPIGAARGITAGQPISTSFFATIGSSFVYGRTINPSLMRIFAASMRPAVSGKSVFSSPSTSSFTRSETPAARANREYRTASSTV